MKYLDYKNYTLLTTEIPNFNSAGLVENSKLYRGSSTINGEKWVRDGSSVEILTQWFKEKVDNLKRSMTYEEVCQAWSGDIKTVTYKSFKLTIFARKRLKDYKVVYLGELLADNPYHYYKSSFESVHYDKVVQKFKRFIDEKCIGWKPCDIQQHNIGNTLYTLNIQVDPENKDYFGSCKIHQNSIFKCFSRSFREIEDKFIARLDQIAKHQQGIKSVNSKEERLKQLETQIAKLQQELEKVKNEKEIYTYKGITLEYGKEEGYLIGEIKNAPEDTERFYRKVANNLKTDFEEYVDRLEKSANLYCQLTGNQLRKNDV